MMLDNVRRKQRQFDDDTALQERFYRVALGLERQPAS